MFFTVPVCVVLVGTAGSALLRALRGGQLTKERQNIYEAALMSLKDPAKLKSLANAFRKNGLTAQADMLDKRARLRELPGPVIKARRAAFRRALKSTNRDAVLAMAAAYHEEGATGAAATLRKYAESLPEGTTA